MWRLWLTCGWSGRLTACLWLVWSTYGQSGRYVMGLMVEHTCGRLVAGLALTDLQPVLRPAWQTWGGSLDHLAGLVDLLLVLGECGRSGRPSLLNLRL